MSNPERIARFRKMERANPAGRERDPLFSRYFDPREFGAKLAALGWPYHEALDRCRLNELDETEFATGYFGTPPCVHFVGFRGEEYWSAVRIWGTPAYTWPEASFRTLGECAPHDTVIFGPSAFNTPRKWRQALAAR